MNYRTGDVPAHLRPAGRRGEPAQTLRDLRYGRLVLTSIDYEHLGRPKWLDDLIEMPAVSVSVQEYRRWLREGEWRRRAFHGGNGAGPGTSRG